eukprot:CAMPEP_0206846778 /NCGR_PEP_ID=MMETSP0975-20121206/25164_1 /ASSEMBLY_ACC=CAM_ASM_000399 /TAXON_ID=483370 /ORGANISM="non described non described, Strain CCMP2097" /LENGTH=60 /DNA_ID=CAMNT_0054389373 /DNA_START=301 /DNA_END=479 /DNA_ORIENTATION=+
MLLQPEQRLARLGGGRSAERAPVVVLQALVEHLPVSFDRQQVEADGARSAPVWRVSALRG